jgi:uncharacterized protein YdeI (YjbR/CyaY-like superfamily)
VDASRYKHVTVDSRARWRRWLEANHGQTESVWLVHYKKHTGRKYVPYGELVEEALCFGWIDGLVKTVDADRVMMLMSPRRRGSAWSKSNKERVDRLIAQGLMCEAGLRKIEAAKLDGSWTAFDDSDAMIVPPDLAAALQSDPRAARGFEALRPSLRRGWLAHLSQAKRPETRAKRIQRLLDLARGDGK